MNEIIKKITVDLYQLSAAVAVSRKNPLFIFKELFYVFLSIILILFLISIGRKILMSFSLSPSRSPFHLRHRVRGFGGHVGHLKGVGITEELLFSLGLGIIFWGTLVLILGTLGFLYFRIVWGIFGVSFLACWSEMVGVVRDIGKIRVVRRKSGIEKAFFYFFFSFIFFNLIGALTPEKGIDALYYHLYYPKVYLQEGTMMLPARGARLFSFFPHIASMIYLLPVSLDLTNVAQLFHMLLGLFTGASLLIIINKLYKSPSLSGGLLFYSTILVGSFSRSAYSDFFITFFLCLAILAFIKATDSGGGNWLILCGLMFGGTLATKNQSLALIPIFFLFFLFIRRKEMPKYIKIIFWSFLVAAPWYLRSYLMTGNFFYPLFVSEEARVPRLAIKLTGILEVTKATLLIQPIFLLIFLAFIFLKKKKQDYLSLVFPLIIFIYWLVLPSSFHDRRTFFPYLILAIISIYPLLNKLLKFSFFKWGFFCLLFLQFLPRLYTNVLYFPYVLGLEEKMLFLSNVLREEPESFYDIDGTFSRVIKNQKVLVDNVIGLYYINFPFTEFGYSPFYGKKMSKDGFIKIWKENNYAFLLFKNESLADFFAKIDLGKEEINFFSLEASHELSKTYLYKVF